MKIRTLLLGVALTVLGSHVAFLHAEDAKDAEEHGKWSVDFEAAKAAAAKEGKSLLMEFTGSDWCPPCKTLHKQVLSKESFLEEAPKHFVLLKLDNPRDKSKQSDEEQAQYKKLSAKYKVRGVPTIILADPEGKPYAVKVGYGGQPADVYVADLVKNSDSLKQRNELMAKAEASKGIAKAKLLDKAISLIDVELAVGTYRDTIDQIVALDADDAAGLKTKYDTIINGAELKSKLQDITRNFRGKPDEALKKIEDLLEEYQPAGETLQEILYTKSMLVYRSDKDAAKDILLEARKIDPKSKLGANINRILEQVFKIDAEKLDAASSDDDAKTDSAEESKKP